MENISNEMDSSDLFGIRSGDSQEYQIKQVHPLSTTGCSPVPLKSQESSKFLDNDNAKNAKIQAIKEFLENDLEIIEYPYHTGYDTFKFFNNPVALYSTSNVTAQENLNNGCILDQKELSLNNLKDTESQLLPLGILNAMKVKEDQLESCLNFIIEKENEIEVGTMKPNLDLMQAYPANKINFKSLSETLKSPPPLNWREQVFVPKKENIEPKESKLDKTDNYAGENFCVGDAIFNRDEIVAKPKPKVITTQSLHENVNNRTNDNIKSLYVKSKKLADMIEKNIYTLEAKLNKLEEAVMLRLNI